MSSHHPQGGLQGEQLDPLAGTAYRALSRIGAGGMAEVWLAEHRGLGRNVAVKLMSDALAGRSDLVDRMRLEARSLASLSHPNIVRVLDAGATPSGRPFLAMELLSGKTLSEELAQRTLHVSEAVSIVREVLAGLQAAHDRGLVHRDIGPGNVMLHVGEDGVRTARLLDFGVAKVMTAGSAGAAHGLGALTAQGFVLGTPTHMAPEQAQGAAVDGRTDIYAVGCLLYRLVAGRGPFDDAGDEVAILTAHVSRPPKPLSEVAGHTVPQQLEDIVGKALAKDPSARFASAHQMSEALAQVQAELQAPADPLANTELDLREVPAAAPKPALLPTILVFTAVFACIAVVATIAIAWIVAGRFPAGGAP